MSEVLGGIVLRLRREQGSDPSSWAWGRLRQLTLQHPIGRIKALAPVFNRGPFPYGGDGNTVSQAASSIRRFGANPGAIASLRAVIDVGDWEAARFSMPGGQSGNPLSPHYDDQLPLWLRGEGVPIPWSSDAVEAAVRQTLRLLPLDGRARVAAAVAPPSLAAGCARAAPAVLRPADGHAYGYGRRSSSSS